MQLSLSTEYAIHSLLYLALSGQERLTYVGEVARAQNISESYLAKVFQTLSKAGLVRSYRGAKGGYMLARSPEDISLEQIVKTMEGNTPIFVCDEQKRQCSSLGNCIIRFAMNEAESRMYEVLEKITLADLVRQAQKLPNSNSIDGFGNLVWSSKPIDTDFRPND